MVLIEGIAFPLDVKNKNGWGIPSTEADNAIKSLLSSVIRICPRSGPHQCDVDEDPNREIGRVIEAYRIPGYIWAKADVTDSIADRKITDGTWGNGWSIYADANGIDSEGWASGVHTKSLTLVNDPAWDESKWTIAASDSELHSLRFYQPFKILSAGLTVTDPIPNTPDGGGLPADYELKLSERDKLIETLTTEKTSLSEQITTLTTELDGLKTVAASRVPMDDVQKMVATEAQKIAASEVSKYKEELAKGVALEKLTAARAKVGLETDVKDYATLTASDVTKLSEDFGKITLSASQVPQYPARGSGSSGGFTVGRPKSDGTWEV